MILLTVGTQLPFDRLVEAVDRLAPRVDEKVVGQVGRSKYIPRNIEIQERFSPLEFDRLIVSARLLISHAGIGSILSAQKHAKPIVIMPRLAKYGEHRNDHQLATCRQLESFEGIFIAHSQEEIEECIGRATTITDLDLGKINYRREKFCDNLKKLIF